MELKMNYQYTYFIHPFAVKENKYQKYILSLVKNEKFNLKIFQKGKDFNLYEYFSPKMKEFLFSSFSHSKAKVEKLKELADDTKSAILSKYPCVIFEYKLKEDIQGKTDEKGIFFKIQKIEVICFNTGICFFVMKTNIENSKYFSDLLNFNYKFRDIKGENSLKGFDKISIQTSAFSDISKLTEFIKDVTGSDIESMKLDIDTEKFLTYSYVCIDSEAWNVNKDFEDIKYNFVKYSNFLSADNSANLELDNSFVLSKWKYAKMGFSKQGVTLFASNADINNFTTLPDKFENEYFYIYILNLYKKLYLKKLENEFSNPSNLKVARKKFIEFTKNLWIQDITDEEIGSNVNYRMSKVFEIDRLYKEMNNKYDILYKDLKVDRNFKAMIFIVMLVSVLLVFNILNYIEMIR